MPPRSGQLERPGREPPLSVENTSTELSYRPRSWRRRRCRWGGGGVGGEEEERGMRREHLERPDDPAYARVEGCDGGGPVHGLGVGGQVGLVGGGGGVVLAVVLVGGLLQVHVGGLVRGGGRRRSRRERRKSVSTW